MTYLNAKGFLSYAERVELARLAALLHKDAVIVNLGVEFGASLHCLRAGNATAKLYGVDWFLDNLDGEVDYIPVEGDTHEVAFEGYADLVFVDAGHALDSVTQDIQAWAKRISSGGYLVFHDYSDSPLHEGVKTAVDTWDKYGFEWVGTVDTLAIYRRLGDKPTHRGRPKKHAQA
jgi:hypothetical protein